MATMVGAAILAAIISTADSLINAVSSNISEDFLPKSSNVRIAQMITAGLGLLGLIMSYGFSNIVDILIQSYELSVSCLLVPVAFALFKREGNFLSAALAMLFGLVAFTFFKFLSLDWPREIVSIFFSGLGFAIGELASRVQSGRVLNSGH
jgi:SSS family solute:Na+ symporter